MKTYYEKRSVAEGMPEKEGHYVVILSDDEGMWLSTTDMPFRNGKFYGLDSDSVSHYLVESPSIDAEKVAVEFAEWLYNNYIQTTEANYQWKTLEGGLYKTPELYHIFLSHQQKGKK